MFERVLDERLEDEVGDEGVAEPGGHPLAHDEPVAEPGPLDGEVMAEEVELVVERDLRLVRPVERDAEQARQVGDDLAGRPDVAVHQRRDGVERVEEEVGVQLHPERLEPGPGQLALELGGPDLPLPRPFAGLGRRSGGVVGEDRRDDPEVDEEVEQEVGEHRVRERHPERRRRLVEQAEASDEERRDEAVEGGRHDAVDDGLPRPPPPDGGEPPGEGGDDRGEPGPHEASADGPEGVGGLVGHAPYAERDVRVRRDDDADGPPERDQEGGPAERGAGQGGEVHGGRPTGG